MPADRGAGLWGKDRRGNPGRGASKSEGHRSLSGRRSRQELMLEITDLVVNYGVITALQGISLQVKQGDIVTLIGANGAGKTTTLKVISGLLQARSGDIRYDGRNIANLRPHQLVRLGISHVPEGRMVFANLSVMENLMM